MKLDIADGSGLVVDMDLFEVWDERDIGYRFLVVLDPAVALGRSVVVVERHAGRDDVENRRAAMGDRGFDERNYLLAIAAEGACDERAAQRQGDRTRINGLEGDHCTLILHRAEVGR